MTSLDWFWILHPALAVVLIYPLLGMVVRLAWQTRQRRVFKVKHPPVVGRDHSELARWLAGGVVLIVLLALSVVIATKASIGQFEGGVARAALLSLVLLGTVVSLVALWRCRDQRLRLAFAGITGGGVLGLGAQQEVWRQDHYWGGVAVTLLMLLSLAARQEILRDLRWRRLHITASVLAAFLFLAQGITGSRDLLEIPLSWQKPAIAACDFNLQQCPELALKQP
ncbi:DUF4079 domain-containing protein [Synechococcus sp. MIT S1220]|uniref:DUF4079 domain-containing protein n=1 Tax=Synechococcus sp. MIT S1220 TaxID=3082549 RepID=UPI0039B0ECCE